MNYNYAQRIRGNFKFKVDLLIFIDFADYPLINNYERIYVFNELWNMHVINQTIKKIRFPTFQTKIS